ncbi:unnamed protein product, partial [Polarella glacialis]
MAPKQAPFTVSVSLGSFCFTAKFFEGKGLRKCKFPFDWLYSSAYMVRHALQDDFKSFLDRAQLLNPEDALVGAAKRRSPSTRSGTGHKKYGKMLYGSGRKGSDQKVVWPHHRLWSKDGEDLASFQRAVARFRQVTSKKDHRILFTLTCPVRSKASLEEVRSEEDEVSGGGKTLAVPQRGGPELSSVAQVKQLFQELQSLVRGSFHLDVVYLVLPAASEAQKRPVARTIMEAGSKKASLTIQELHCVGENTGLFFKNGLDTKSFQRLATDGKPFKLASVDDSVPVKMSDSLRTSRAPQRPARTARGAASKLRASIVAKRRAARATVTRRGTSAKGPPARRGRPPGAKKPVKASGAARLKRKIKVLQDNPKLPGGEAHARYESYK